ncbi:Heat shock factor protein [Cucumispora dikerogammari]|nr:Heat shock factor protein [Cucumispora dikerogammari]
MLYKKKKFTPENFKQNESLTSSDKHNTMISNNENEYINSLRSIPVDSRFNEISADNRLNAKKTSFNIQNQITKQPSGISLNIPSNLLPKNLESKVIPTNSHNYLEGYKKNISSHKDTTLANITDRNNTVSKNFETLGLFNKIFNNDCDTFLNISHIIRAETPKFLLNLYRILSFNSEICKSVCWNPEGTGLVILNKRLIMDEIGPFVTKSKDLSGFLRQLSNYEFVKTKKFLCDSDKDEYCSPYFIRGRPDLLVNGSNKHNNVNAHKYSNNKDKLQLCTINDRSRQKQNDEIYMKLKLLEETNFELQKHIMKLEKKNNQQDLIIEKMACFVSKLYFTQINVKDLNENDFNALKSLCEKFPSLEQKFNATNKSPDYNIDHINKHNKSIVEIFTEVEKLGVNNRYLKEGKEDVKTPHDDVDFLETF